MTSDEFRNSLNATTCPTGLTPLLQSLWYDAKGNWEKAHEICQTVNTADAARVHGYLHRKEGDLSNADYWYRRAGTKSPSIGLEEEWVTILKSLL